jgi:hypothetical protein
VEARTTSFAPLKYGTALIARIAEVEREGWLGEMTLGRDPRLVAELLAPTAISGMLATRVAGAMLKLSRGDDGIAAGLDADHGHGHGGRPWREKTVCGVG